MREKKSFIFLAISIVFILFVGLVVSLIQLQRNNSLSSRADTSSEALVDCNIDTEKVKISPEEQKLLDEINLYRKQFGLNALVWSRALVRGSAWMSNDMLVNRYLSHEDSLGRDINARLADCGYVGFTAVGENIDSGTPDGKAIFEAWKHSPQQNANLLSEKFKEIGIALESDSSKNYHFWTVDLGTKEKDPSPTSPANPSTTPGNSPTLPPGVSPSPTLYPTSIPSPTIVPTGVYKSPTPKLTSPLTPQISPGISPTLLPTGVYASPTPKISGSGNPGSSLSLIPTINNNNSLTPPSTITPTVHPDFVKNPYDMQIHVIAKVKGIGEDGNLFPKHLTRRITVGLYDIDNNLVSNGYGYIIYDGKNLFDNIIHFGPVEDGIYYVKIVAEHMLQVVVQPTFQDMSKERLNILPQITLLQGDIDDNNVIDIQDYNLALGCFQQKRCEDAELIDFNDDEKADVVDYNLLLQNYWETQGD